jgi:MFS family permease
MIGSSATAVLAFALRSSLELPNTRARRPTLRELRQARVGKLLFFAWLLGVFKLGTYWSCYTWLPGFLKNEMHQGIGKSVAWMLTAQVGQFFGMIVFGFVSDRVGRRIAFSAFSGLTALAIAPLAFAWSALSAYPPLFWSAMLALGIGSGCTAGFGALLAELFPTEVRGAAMGTVYNLARAAQLGAPVLVGLAVSSAGLEGGLSVPMALALATASWVWALPETRGIRLPSLAMDPEPPQGLA